jgi:hypothetical protein
MYRELCVRRVVSVQTAHYAVTQTANGCTQPLTKTITVSALGSRAHLVTGPGSESAPEI